MSESSNIEEIVLPIIGDATSYIQSLQESDSASAQFLVTVNDMIDGVGMLQDAIQMFPASWQSSISTVGKYLLTTTSGLRTVALAATGVGVAVAAGTALWYAYKQELENLNEALERSKKLTDENVEAIKRYGDAVGETARKEDDPIKKAESYQQGINRLQKEYADSMRNHEQQVKEARQTILSGDSWFGAVSQASYNEAKTTIENYEKLMGGKSEAIRKLQAEYSTFLQSEEYAKGEKDKQRLELERQFDPDLKSLDQLEDHKKRMAAAQREIDLFGKGKLEAKLYDLALSDLTDQSKRMLEQKYRELDVIEKEAEAKEEARKEMEKHQKEWEREGERRLDALNKEMEKRAKERERELDKLKNEAEKVSDSVATPFEAASKEMERLNMLYGEGVLNAQDYGRAVNKLGEELRKKTHVDAPKSFDAGEATPEYVAQRLQEQKDLLWKEQTGAVETYDPKKASDQMISLLGQIKDGLANQFIFAPAGIN